MYITASGAAVSTIRSTVLGTRLVGNLMGVVINGDTPTLLYCIEKHTTTLQHYLLLSSELTH